MKKSDVQPNTIYRVRASRHGTRPHGFNTFVLTGDEIIGVAGGRTYSRYDTSTKRYIEVYPIRWNRDAGQYVADADTRQIAFKDIDGDYGDQGAMGDITAKELERREQDNQRYRDEKAQAEVNKTRWAALDTATLDLLNVGDYDRPGSVSEYSDTGLTGGMANEGIGSVQVRLTLDAIEAIDALIVWARLSREVSA